MFIVGYGLACSYMSQQVIQSEIDFKRNILVHKTISNLF